MPIPQWPIQEWEGAPLLAQIVPGAKKTGEKPVLVLVQNTQNVSEEREPTWRERAWANIFDLNVVNGLGFGLAKVVSFVALSPVFWQGWLGSPRILNASFVRGHWPVWILSSWASATFFCALFYFVLVPYFFRRTLGQGLCGITLRAKDRRVPTLRQHMRRYLIYLLSFTSMGYPFYYAWRKKELRTLVDHGSETFFVKD